MSLSARMNGGFRSLQVASVLVLAACAQAPEQHGVDATQSPTDVATGRSGVDSAGRSGVDAPDRRGIDGTSAGPEVSDTVGPDATQDSGVVGPPDAGVPDTGGGGCAPACGVDEVCDRQGCGPSAPGVCVPAPLGSCGYAPGEPPECGCDGNSYINECHRIDAGVGKAHAGECTDEEGCLATGCPVGEVCDQIGCDDGFGYPSRACVPKPETCCPLVIPECGCNGVTYPNACERQSAGVARDGIGSCGDGGIEWLCFGVDDCEEGWFCHFDDCELLLGLCVEGVPSCDSRCVPVCGCDGATYANDCDRIAAGIGTAPAGTCK